MIDNIIDISGQHAGRHRQGARSWAQIDGICLHQTACVIGERAESWFGVPVQVGVTRGGIVYILNPLEQFMWHGHGLNGRTVGIEIDGHYAGIEGDLRTYWRPPSLPDRKPLALVDAQIDAARAAVEHIIATVADHGGAITRIFAHRQASNQRQSDPGSAIWKAVGLWAQDTCGLDDGGPGYVLGSGMAIPEAWDGRRVGFRY